ncbi:hypothetical protein RRG08_028013 [Elysia crispata]|uniref:Uncharacterized protein n=1 Tax=Elysia crispata TaxID=231223 RepID=A0AAE1BBG8_9GAST|nr:hypothetical protein RRG08_028013 [Elysia crispata]
MIVKGNFGVLGISRIQPVWRGSPSRQRNMTSRDRPMTTASSLEEVELRRISLRLEIFKKTFFTPASVCPVHEKPISLGYLTRSNKIDYPCLLTPGVFSLFSWSCCNWRLNLISRQK